VIIRFIFILSGAKAQKLPERIRPTIRFSYLYRMKKKIVFTLFLTFLLTYLFGQTRKIVPDQFATIQDAVDSTNNGDTVLVKPGTYYGVVDFKGKEILVTSLYRINKDTSFISSTIITRHPTLTSFEMNRAAWFKNGETSKSELSGFTIKGFSANCCGEGIIEIVNASPRLSYPRLSNIYGTSATVISIDGTISSGPVVLEQVEIFSNNTPINSKNASLTLINCSITNNSRGIIQNGGELILINSLIDDNYMFGGVNFTGRKLAIFNSISRAPSSYAVTVLADSLIINNSIASSIEIKGVKFVDTVDFKVNTNQMYYVNGHRPSRYSPNINMGVSIFTIGNTSYSAPTIDIDGISRAWKPDNIIDIGPYEYRKDDNATYQPPSISLTASKQFVCDDEDYIITAITEGPARYTTYKWFHNYSPYKTTMEPTISATGWGSYQVVVHDEIGAEASTYITIQPVYPFANRDQQILCFASVDTTKQVNKLTWAVIPGIGIKSYEVFRETNVSGQLQAIASIPFSQGGIYYDIESKPGEGSSGYLIKVKTTCDELIEDGQTLHRTIHLSATKGLNGEINLIWVPYQGTGPGVSTYKILRGSKKNNMEQIAEKSASTSSFTDVDPPDGPLYYVIQAVVSSTCASISPSNPPVNSEGLVFSNILFNGVTVGIEKPHNFDFKVYPIPIENKFIVTAPEPIKEVTITDLLGREQRKILIVNDVDSIELERGGLNSGVYLIEIICRNKKSIRKIIIE